MHQARHGAGSPARHSADTSASQSRHSADTSASQSRHSVAIPASLKRHSVAIPASLKRHSAATSLSRIRPRVLVALVVAGAGLATAIWLPTRQDAADASERARTRQQAQGERRVSQQGSFTFADNFSGGQGSRVDGDKWSVETGSDRGAALDGDGHLVLAARRQGSGEFTTARLQTQKTFKQAYGQAEARIKVADGNGILSAFRLLGADVNQAGEATAGEVDVVQNAGQKSRVVRGGIQGPGSSGDDEISGTLNAENSFADGFHTYAVTWQPDLIVWSVDGAEFFRATTADPNFFDQPFFLSLDLAVDPQLSSDTRSAEPMLVDFVHVTAFDDKTPPSDDPTAPPTTAPTTAPTTEPPATEPPATEPPTTAPTTAPPATVPPTTPPTSEAPAATPWKPFTDYIAGQLVTYKGIEYQVQETHTSLPGWEPPALPNLFKKL